MSWELSKENYAPLRGGRKADAVKNNDKDIREKRRSAHTRTSRKGELSLMDLSYFQAFRI